MPIVMTMQWDGVTVEQYEQVRKLVTVASTSPRSPPADCG